MCLKQGRVVRLKLDKAPLLDQQTDIAEVRKLIRVRRVGIFRRQRQADRKQHRQ